MKVFKMKKEGFTLIELLVVVGIIGILSSMILPALNIARERGYFSKANQELQSIRLSLEYYYDDYGGYPADANRDVPPGLEPYLAPGIWPNAAWPKSVFDWENWSDPNTGEEILQVSIRFCPLGDPSGCQFPTASWASNFDYYSSVYYCISGPCRSHISKPINHPGYCVNCDQ